MFVLWVRIWGVFEICSMNVVEWKYVLFFRVSDRWEEEIKLESYFIFEFINCLLKEVIRYKL